MAKEFCRLTIAGFVVYTDSQNPGRSSINAASSVAPESKSSKSSDSNGAKAVTPSLDVEFVSARVDNDAGRKRSTKEADSRDAGAGGGKFIEDIYGVERRENRPYKRVKSGEPTRTQNKADFTATGDSQLGKWMKDGQRKLDNLPPASLDVVDLTNSRDGKALSIYARFDPLWEVFVLLMVEFLSL